VALERTMYTYAGGKLRMTSFAFTSEKCSLNCFPAFGEWFSCMHAYFVTAFMSVKNCSRFCFVNSVVGSSFMT